VQLLHSLFGFSLGRQRPFFRFFFSLDNTDNKAAYFKLKGLIILSRELNKKEAGVIEAIRIDSLPDLLIRLLFLGLFVVGII